MGRLELAMNNSAVTATGSPGGLAPSRVLAAFGAGFLDQEACRRYLLAVLHPRGPVCPHCRQPLPTAQHQRWQALERLQCACGRWITAATGTILHGAKISPAQVVLLALCLALGLEDAALASIVGVSAETARQWRARLEDAA